MSVLLCGEVKLANLQVLLDPYGLSIKLVAVDNDIPGSFWQPPEASLINNNLFVRDDTPMHSALHEACHYICMNAERRNALDTNAGGNYEEENGVCYLQILFSHELPEMGVDRMFSDMDTWGYTFRLGSGKAWFEHDANDARQWLLQHAIINKLSRPTWNLRID